MWICARCDCGSRGVLRKPGVEIDDDHLFSLGVDEAIERTDVATGAGLNNTLGGFENRLSVDDDPSGDFVASPADKESTSVQHSGFEDEIFNLLCDVRVEEINSSRRVGFDQFHGSGEATSCPAEQEPQAAQPPKSGDEFIHLSRDLGGVDAHS